ncbi:MAG: alpha/beta hydrolase [Ruminococcaceae bacterium]|nr:alpha/beta hydrolase [Oscillospiraceae bacterium]
MICQTVTLSPYENATLTSICITNTAELKQAPRRAVIVCPGGGYHFLSDREAEPIATQFLAAGFATFILRYTVEEGAKDYAPLCEAALAIRYVREHAEEFNVDPDYVFICGFSAGGHLAASSGVLWDIPEVRAVLGDAPRGIGKPTGMVLSYPVITAGELAHKGSIHNLCGTKTPTEAEADRFSLEKHVDATTSPAFIWHTFDDQIVPVQNSLMFAEALTAVGVPFEMHIFPKGPHGLSLCNEQTGMLSPHTECWMELAIRWLKDFT